MRKEMGEAYRTLLGHLRHEVGHYYWDRLIRDTPWCSPFRALFGDERLDYGQAAARHYARGAPSDWERSYVSAYATMHPWEDWAETWSHYLHMVDTLDTARAYSLALQAKPIGGEPGRKVRVRSLKWKNFDSILAGWVQLTIALNSLNRSMGLNDPYPFVLSERAITKLRFVHDAIEHWRDKKLDQALARWPAWVEAPVPVIEPEPSDTTPEPSAAEPEPSDRAPEPAPSAPALHDADPGERFDEPG
jgi:hypothetical protein